MTIFKIRKMSQKTRLYSYEISFESFKLYYNIITYVKIELDIKFNRAGYY